MNLRELQESFFSYLRERSTADSISFVREQKGITSQQRLDSYKRSHLNRLVSIFKKDYAVTAKFYGEDEFEQVLRRYVCDAPSTAHPIIEINKRLPSHLKENLPTHVPDFFLDLVDLEWKMLQSFYDYLSYDTITDSGNSQYFITRSLLLYTSDWPLDKIWLDEKVYERQSTHLIVWATADRDVFVDSCTNTEAAVLQALQKASSLEESVEMISDEHDTDEVAAVYQNKIPYWVRRRIMTIHS